MKPLLLATLSALCLVTAAFAQPPVDQRPPKIKQLEGPFTPAELEEVMKRLDQMVIKEVNFQQADLNAVIDFLVDECRRMDPVSAGVSVIVREVPAGTTIRSLRLRDIKFLDVIKVICDLANMRYVITPRGLVIVPAGSTFGLPFETKSFAVAPALIRYVLQMAMDAPPSSPPPPIPAPLAGSTAQQQPRRQINLASPSSVDLVWAFESLGLEFPPSANLSYSPALRRLTIANLVKNVELLEKLLPELEAARRLNELERRLEQTTAPLDDAMREFKELVGRASDSEWVKLRQQIAVMERESFDLARQLREERSSSQRAELRKKLENMLGKIHDAKVVVLEKEIRFLQSSVSSRKKDKNQLLKSRLEELTKPQPKP